ncbi:cysteine-rich protein [Crucibulum laeve]|uniref:Cysteine-rich protein n=1 Tax=Crucibulum laeve TaxID=68775 RepID=A0A5C3LK81_9AGAR|nr:cysteine-rich protein [Crucibulum laeve]
MRLSTLTATLAMALVYVPTAEAGIISYGICQTGCNVLAVACYAAAGFTFGTVVAAAAAPPAILACNAGLGTCSSACAVVALTPTP